jgi:hypothetical protein
VFLCLGCQNRPGCGTLACYFPPWHLDVLSGLSDKTQEAQWSLNFRNNNNNNCFRKSLFHAILGYMYAISQAEISSWDMGLWGSLAGSNMYCASTDPADSCPKTEPREQRGLTLYTLATGYRSKEQSSTHIWLHVTSLAVSLPQCYVTFFMLQFFTFYLSAMPSFPPATLSEHKLVCFFSGPLSCYIFPLWCSDPPRVKEHHLDLGVCIFIASLHGRLFFYILATIMALMDHNTKGTKQGNIKHAPKTRPITPAFHDKMLPAFFFFTLWL